MPSLQQATGNATQVASLTSPSVVFLNVQHEMRSQALMIHKRHILCQQIPGTEAASDLPHAPSIDVQFEQAHCVRATDLFAVVLADIRLVEPDSGVLDFF